MIVRSFLKWYQSAGVQGRIEAVQVLADAYLSGQLGADSPADVEAALTLVLDDASPAVRRALAWKLALSEKAPRHLLVGLAHDRAEVSALILARSPQIRDPDLIDCARTGDGLTHLAIARRHQISPVVAATLADVASGDALTVLCENPGAEISAQSFPVMVRRHPEHGALREALARRDDLPSAVRQSLVASVSAHLMAFVGSTGMLEAGRAQRLIGDTREMATITLALEASDLGPYVEHLRETGQLTPSLLLRGVLCGDVTLFGGALVCLTGMAPKRVAGILKSRGPAFLALYNKAALPAHLFAAFDAGLSAIRQLKLDECVETPRLSRAVIQSVLTACLPQDEATMRPVLALLRRFDAEAARDDARMLTAELMQENAPTTLNAEIAPPINLESFAEALQIEDDFTDYALEAQRGLIEQAEALEAMVVRPMVVEPMKPDLVMPEPLPDLEIDQYEDALPFVEPAVQDNEPEAVAADADEPVLDDTEIALDDEAIYHDELDALFSAAFGSDEPAPSTGSLRVIERLSDQLDSDFFNSWDIRRNAA